MSAWPPPTALEAALPQQGWKKGSEQQQTERHPAGRWPQRLEASPVQAPAGGTTAGNARGGSSKVGPEEQVGKAFNRAAASKALSTEALGEACAAAGGWCAT